MVQGRRGGHCSAETSGESGYAPNTAPDPPSRANPLSVMIRRSDPASEAAEGAGDRRGDNNGGRDGGEQEPLDRGLERGARESRAQIPLEPPQPRHRRHLRRRCPHPRLQRHRPRIRTLAFPSIPDPNNPKP